MVFIDDLTTRHASSPNNTDVKRMYFCIYYKISDNAFKHAAFTWENYIKQQEKFNPKQDLFLNLEVISETHFKSAWTQICMRAKAENRVVCAGNLLTHASKQQSGTDGLEFKRIRNEREDGTLNKAEIIGLPKLPWDKNSYLILSGCNTGIKGSRGWCPAEIFATYQNVNTLGQSGYAYFSSFWNEYKVRKANASQTYLWAYHHGKNAELAGFSSTGKRIKAILYRGHK